MNERAEIFARIRRALDGHPARTPRPEIDPAQWVSQRRLIGDDLWDSFANNLQAVRGHFLSNIPDLKRFLGEQQVKTGYCDPTLQEEVGDALSSDFEMRYAFERTAIDEPQFGITRGVAVIAETGTIVLNDQLTSNRLGALAPWIHIAVVRAEAIYRTVDEALAALGQDPNVVWVSGPSKTADVEGILIEGVHGPGEQACLRL